VVLLKAQISDPNYVQKIGHITDNSVTTSTISTTTNSFNNQHGTINFRNQ